MADNKYISKVKVGESNYLVKDDEARVLADSATKLAESALSKCDGIESEHDKYKAAVDTALADLDARKVDKEEGKGLSTNDYTTAEKNKLAGIEEGAQVNDPNTVVDANYVHTDNNYTTAEKNKLSGIEVGAQKNTVTSVASKTGDVVLNKDDVGLNNVDNTADEDKQVAHAATAGDSDTLDGKQAVDFLLKTEHEEYASTISTALTDLDSRKVDKEEGKGLSSNDYTDADKKKLAGIEAGAQKHIAPTADEIKNALGFTPADSASLDDYLVTVTESGESENILKSYLFTQNGSQIAKIDIPKDLVVTKDGSGIVVGNWVNDVFTEDPNGSGKAIKLVVANQKDPIYINVQDLVDVYTAEQGATEIQLTISNTNEISATLVKAVRDKIDNAIPKVLGAEGKIPKFNKDGNLESSTFELNTNVPADALFTDTIIDNEAGDGIEVSGEHNKTIALSLGTKTILVDAVSDHAKLGGHTIGKDVPADAALTDYQTTKAGHYTPSDNDKTLSPDTSVLRDATRDMAFVGAVNEDSKKHAVSIDTCAILAFTDAEITSIINQVIAELSAEME